MFVVKNESTQESSELWELIEVITSVFPTNMVSIYPNSLYQYTDGILGCYKYLGLI